MWTNRKPAAGSTIELRIHTNHFNAERHLYNRSNLNLKLNRAATLTEWRGLGVA
jgi:hypothetical protein